MSGAYVRRVIRERERTHSLWVRAANGQGGVQKLRASFRLQEGRGRKKKATRKGANRQYREYRHKKRTGRVMSSRSTVIVPETGEPEPNGTLTSRIREGLYLEKELTGGNTMDTSDL
jgi:hypothetical protein